MISGSLPVTAPEAAVPPRSRLWFVRSRAQRGSRTEPGRVASRGARGPFEFRGFAPVNNERWRLA